MRPTSVTGGHAHVHRLGPRAQIQEQHLAGATLSLDEGWYVGGHQVAARFRALGLRHGGGVDSCESKPRPNEQPGRAGEGRDKPAAALAQSRAA